MNNSEMHSIKTKINKMPAGSVFVVSDFTNNIDYENAKKCLSRLEKEGFIRRIKRGIYDKPYFSQILNEYSAPNIEETAKAIARNYNWTISPFGLTAINLLGLSTQVTNSYEYYSTGQYKSYDIGNITISFKHKSSKDMLGLSYKSALIINAIKEMRPPLDNRSIETIRRGLSKEEKDTLLEESKRTTKWVYEIIKKICK